MRIYKVADDPSVIIYIKSFDDICTLENLALSHVDKGFPASKLDLCL
jgi:hypothetical protein